MTHRAIITEKCQHCDNGVVRMDAETARRLMIPQAFACFFCEGVGRIAVSPTRAELMAEVRDELSL